MIYAFKIGSIDLCLLADRQTRLKEKDLKIESTWILAFARITKKQMNM
jgi:hypothetical protein